MDDTNSTDWFTNGTESALPVIPDPPLPNPTQPITFAANLMMLGTLLAIPTLFMMLGSMATFLSNAGPKTFSGMQHLAGGVLLGAVLWEIGPTIKPVNQQERFAVMIGFIAGFSCLMLIARAKFKTICRRKEETEEEDVPESLENFFIQGHSPSKSKSVSRPYQSIGHHGSSRTPPHRNYAATVSRTPSHTPSKDLSIQQSPSCRMASDDELSTQKTKVENPLINKSKGRSKSFDEIDSEEPITCTSTSALSSTSSTPTKLSVKFSPPKFSVSRRPPRSTRVAWPIGLITAVWVNGAIDGLLIGIAYINSGTAGFITSLALSLEQCLLGMTTANSLSRTRSQKLSVAVSLPLALPIPVFGLIAGVFLADLDGALFNGINAFGVAGLLYLVTEELLIEAHEDEVTDKWYVSGLLFVGFLFVILLDMFIPS